MKLVVKFLLPSQNLTIALIHVAISGFDPSNNQLLFILILVELLNQRSLQLDQTFRFANIIPVLDFIAIQEHLEEGLLFLIALRLDP